MDDSELSPRRLFTEKDNEGVFDDLLPGNLVVGLKPGPTKPTISTRTIAIIDARCGLGSKKDAECQCGNECRYQGLFG